MSPRSASYFNVVDVLVLAFLVVLVPVGYSSWLMFRPARPQIESVQPSRVLDQRPLP